MRRFERQRSRGFTLIEILVVIAIIGILAALTLQAASQLIDSQRHSNTENLLRVIDKTLQQQIRAVVELADKEWDGNKVPALTRAKINLWTAIGGVPDPRRGKVIWRKLRLKQEFPMTFDEALNPWKYSLLPLPLPITSPPPPQMAADPPPAANVTAFQLLPTELPPKTRFTNELTGASGRTPEEQSSACLLLCLQDRATGSLLDPETLSPGSIVTRDFGGRQVKLLVDFWGTALAFFRHPVGNLDSPFSGNPNTPVADVDSSTTVAAKTASAAFRDPLDPEGKLVNPVWNRAGSFNTWQGVYWFERYCHPVHEWRNAPTLPPAPPTLPGANDYRPKAVFTLAMVVSAGKNTDFGLSMNLRQLMAVDVAGIDVLPAGQQATRPPQSASFMGPPGTAQNAANDNIYSWRLRMGATGAN